MKKKILIGSIIAVALLLLMPSIPAIHNNAIKDEIISELPEDFNLKNIRELLESWKLDRVKHPILMLLVTIWMYFRLIRGQILADISYDITYEYDYNFEIYHPVLFLRLLILLINTGLVVCSFQGLSDLLGWNWNIPI